jgi:hypothetical protein
MRLFDIPEEAVSNTKVLRIELPNLKEKMIDVINIEMKRLKVRLNKQFNREELTYHILSNISQELADYSVSNIFSLGDGFIDTTFSVDKEDMVDVSNFKWLGVEKVKKVDISSKMVETLLEMTKTQTIICVMSVGCS